jgi:flagellar basal body-associated protein FliL
MSRKECQQCGSWFDSSSDDGCGGCRQEEERNKLHKEFLDGQEREAKTMKERLARMMKQKERKKRMKITLIVIGTVLLIVLVGGALYGCPHYKVYSKRLDGEAKLRQQESERKIMIEDAKAKNKSAVLLAEAKITKAKGDAKAEVVRAKGVAEANKIIGESLKENEAYLRYLWIQGLQDGSSEVIYIPTEANLPLLEANGNRRGK